MKLNNSFYKRKNQLIRKIGSRGQPKQTFLIICEGKKTEPNYFRAFHLSNVNVKVIGIGQNTKSLVKATIDNKLLALSYDVEYDQIWCVFDKDDFPDNDFNDAIQLAQINSIHPAYYNESFELWYLLHFQYFESAIHRNNYMKKLSQLLGEKYKKNDKTVYDKLLPQQKIAIQNAKKLLKSYSSINPSKNNPSTTVYLLVEELNKYI